MPEHASGGHTLRVGADTGGTFTDITFFDPATQKLTVWKVSSTTGDPSEAIATGIREGLEHYGRDAGEIGYVGHGTTVATNALITGQFARTAMATTKGFRDVIEIRRQMRPDLYDLQQVKPAPLIPRDMRFELDERVDFDGSVRQPLDPEAVRALAREMKAQDVEAVAVGFLFSYLFPGHEAEAKRILAEELPDVFISTSSEVAAEYREYERFSTTVINAALGPVMQGYLNRLRPRLRELGIAEDPHLTQSNGGVISATEAATYPVRTVLSGPAAGVMGAREIAVAAGMPDVITFDMGGTSSDVAMISGGRPQLATDTEVHGHPLKVPMLDIHAVGAGGGSISAVDSGGHLKVGPRSAGAVPGPVCYGKGNTEPTVTDANVVLQVLNPTHLLAGRLEIDRDASVAAVQRLADRLGLGVMETAQGIISVATANMAKAIRVISVERGHDPRDYALMAFGGAGPLHAARLARELDMPRILIPRNPGILCSMGLLLTDLKSYFSLGRMTPLDADRIDSISADFATLDAEADAWFKREDIAPDARETARTLDLRYEGQAFELSVDCPEGPVTPDLLAEVRRRFEDAHRQVYGYASPDEPVHIIAIRLVATGKVDNARLVTSDPATTPVSDAQTGTRDVWLPETGAFTPCPLYDRDLLGPDHVIDGPAIVEQMDTTVFLLPGQRATVDSYLNLVIEETAE
ncbi:hydantoinase/oxoprolinase family protein [Psychromarinibacter halotolerans]|uniref:Hydantoinase/oxoprolinase family protein n=1 Tax=Psychromarinibacter halotolerans TaxID=1775175 RepID=A0ABV7GNC5_9RHOB|nr:hydantoinase/oxoprolinase family protein [Psychromarinibacter halotolerans]MDF0596850.1 hydantoinase/oxoprolinase family protein [Psychromarinibacter halotolerans]